MAKTLIPAMPGAARAPAPAAAPRRRGRLAHRLVRPLGLALLVAGLAVTQAAAADERYSNLPGFWGDVGVGFGSLDTSSAPYGDSRSSYVVDGTLGGRVSDHFLIGVNLRGQGAQLNDNYNCNYSYYCSSYNSDFGQFVSNLFLVAQFEPGWDHGWTFGAGAGQVYYHNRVLEDITGDYRSGDGAGGMVRVGYDWPVAGHAHVEARLTLEAGHVNLNSNIGGNFNYHSVMLTVHIAHH